MILFARMCELTIVGTLKFSQPKKSPPDGGLSLTLRATTTHVVYLLKDATSGLTKDPIHSKLTPLKQ